MTETLKPFVHRDTGRSYLFGFEDYMDIRELEDLWGSTMWITKDFSERPYGEISPHEIIEIAAMEVGLRQPARGSGLRKFVMEHAGMIAANEVDQLRDAQEGRIELDLNEEFDETSTRAILEMRRSA